MKSDCSLIQFDGDNVYMPLSVYEELRTFARGHGETDLPIFEKLQSEISGTLTVVPNMWEDVGDTDNDSDAK